MSHDSSGQATAYRSRAAALATREGRAYLRRTDPRRRLKIVLLVVMGVFLVILAFVGWVGIRGIIAKGALEEAEGLLSTIQDQAKAGDFDAAVAEAARLVELTETAASLTSDPIWRAAEVVPGAGPSLTVTRELADVVNRIVRDGVDPLLDVADSGIEAFKPVDGRIDVARVESVAELVANASAVVEDAGERIAGIDTDGAIGQLVAAKDRIEGLVARVTPMIRSMSDLAGTLPAMLGSEGPRNYILVFQNNAESSSLGGGAAAWAIVNITDGVLSIVNQVSSADFDRTLGAPIPIDPALYALYEPFYFGYANNITLRPDFPTTGALAQGFYQRLTGQVVDGVVSLDPVALGYLLAGTGPLDLPTGQQLSSENAVSLLLSDAYVIFPDPLEQDAFFASAAVAVFDALTSGQADIAGLVPGMLRSIQEDRFMVWSAHPDEEAAIMATPLAGVMPADNVAQTQIGVYFVENSASKMSYYLQTEAKAVQSCEGDPVDTVTMTLTSTLTPEQEAALPAYVRSQVYLDPPMTRTMVLVYGPVGGELLDWTGSGGSGVQLLAAASDLGRPVYELLVDLTAGQSASVTVRFAGGTEPRGPLDLRVTPMVRPTTVIVESCEPRS